MRKLLAFVFIFLLAGIANATPISLDALEARYKSVTSVSAEIDQEKTGAYLAKPLKSKIDLEYAHGRILWITQSPVKSKVTLEGQTLKIQDSNGATKEITAKSGTKPDALLWFIQSLLAFDVKALQSEFDLKIDGQKLLASPKKNSRLSFLKSVAIVFNSNLDPETLTIEAEKEQTTLHFASISTTSSAEKKGP